MAENIFVSISAIMSEIGAIRKTKEHSQHFNYRGVDDVMNALQPLLYSHKVFVVPEVMKQTREERTTSKGALLIYSILKMKFKFYAEDGSSVEAVTIGEAFDSGDKASNKAMSIAFKYACFQVFCIPTEEMIDPDGSRTPSPAPRQFMNEKYSARIDELLEKSGVSRKALMSSIKNKYGHDDIMGLQSGQYTQVTDFLKAEAEKKNKSIGDESLV